MKMEYTPAEDILQYFIRSLNEANIDYEIKETQVLVYPKTERERIKTEECWECAVYDACRDSSIEGGE